MNMLKGTLWEAKACYALSSGGASSLVNYLPVFWETAGLTKVQMAFLQTVGSVCSMVSPPLWGAVADAIDNQRLIHVTTTLTAMAVLWTMQFTTSFTLMAVLIFVGYFFRAPAQALLDTSVLNLLDKVGGEYGKQRMFGAVGFGCFAYLTGLLVSVGGLSWSFHMQLILGVLGVVILQWIPAPKKHSETNRTDEETGLLNSEPETKPPTLLEGLQILVKQTDVLVLFGVVLCLSIMCGVLSSFLTLNLYILSGEDPQIVGIAILAETTSELPAFFFSQKIISKIGTVNVLLLSAAAFATRITYYAVMTSAWSAIPFEFLHGISFGMSWAAITQYVYTRAPKGAEATVMGLLNAVQNGLGKAIGSFLGGLLYENYGARTMWLVTDVCVPLSLIGIALFAYFKREAEQAADEQEMLDASAQLFSPQNAASTFRSRSPSYDSDQRQSFE